MAAKTGPSLPSPDLVWDAGDIPRARRFDDVYFSRDGGVAEKRHVFLNGCGLPKAWQDRNAFTICELGFGVGLNFLITWDAWRKQRPHDARLHYIAIEGFPLAPAELQEAITPWPDLQPVADALAARYPQPQRGFHRVALRVGDGDASIILTFLFGEVGEMLSALEAGVDAWYLDGFAPDKNPAMWRPEVFAQIARLSHAGPAPTRLATYSVAGSVRRGLEEVGFDVERVPGFGGKREMLQARFRARPANITDPLPPWFARPQATPPRGHAAVVGAGIAGASVCHALRNRGWRVTMIDRHGAAGVEASGNPVGVLMPRLTAGDSIEGDFHAAAWRFALNSLETLSDAEIARHRCGVLQLARDDAETQRLAAIAGRGVLPDSYLLPADAAEVTAHAGFPIARAGLFFPQGGTVAPPLLCRALIGAHEIHRADVAGAQHTEEGVEILDAQGAIILRADIVVFANAHDAAATSGAAWLPLSARRGQITLVPAMNSSQGLRTVLMDDGYVTPAIDGVHCLGATFDWTDNGHGAQTVIAEDHTRNLAMIAAQAPGLFGALAIDDLEGRAAVRCMTPDHLPIAGPLPDRDAYLADYQSLRHGQHWVKPPAATYRPGIYVLTGLGARGLVTAPLAAEILACHITGEPWPIARELVTALHPARFLVRDLKRTRT